MKPVTHSAFCRSLPVLVAGLLALSACLRVDAAPTNASEAAVKVAYLFNVVKFTEFPGAATQDTQSLVVCSDATGELRDALESLNGKSVKGRTVVITRVAETELAKCQVILIDTTAGVRYIRTDLPILTVTTLDRADAMVRFFVDQRRLRFAVNLAAARRGSIKFSAKLLNVAAEVNE